MHSYIRPPDTLMIDMAPCTYVNAAFAHNPQAKTENKAIRIQGRDPPCFGYSKPERLESRNRG